LNPNFCTYSAMSLSIESSLWDELSNIFFLGRELSNNLIPIERAILVSNNHEFIFWKRLRALVKDTKYRKVILIFV
jgi:hypothetical protein